MPKSPSSPFQPFLDAVAASGAALADGARAEIEAAGTLLQAQMTALSTLTAVPPASSAATLAQAGDLWFRTVEAGIASAARAAETVAKAGASVAGALKPAG